jgi:hypothetical protein
VAIREVEDRGFEAEQSLPPALPAEATQDATEEPASKPEHRVTRFTQTATLAMLAFLAAVSLVWVSGIVLLIRRAVAALFG